MMNLGQWLALRSSRRLALGAGVVALGLFALHQRSPSPPGDAPDTSDGETLSGAAAPPATTKVYGQTVIQVEHGPNCWTPTQIRLMANRRTMADITEVVIHWTGGGYAGSLAALRGVVSAHYLVPLAPSPARPTWELIDPLNAAWHAGPLNRGLWEDQAHTICRVGSGCAPNGNIHSIGIECEGSTVPNVYQVGVLTDILAGLIRDGFPLRLDRAHVVGHRDLDRQKTDPGNLDLDHVIALTAQKVAAANTALRNRT
jgi:hypothetical protein